MNAKTLILSGLYVGTVLLSLNASAFADEPSGNDSDARAAIKSETSETKHSASRANSASRVARLESVQNEDMAAAVGHYARARSLLIAALNEFDSGMKIANPDSLLDSKLFRTGLIDRAEELERILDPQPRATKGGVKYNADPRLLGRK